jgi:hypothetical protein
MVVRIIGEMKSCIISTKFPNRKRDTEPEMEILGKPLTQWWSLLFKNINNTIFTLLTKELCWTAGIMFGGKQ